MRPAVIEDLDTLVQMGIAMHAESPRYSQRSFNVDKVRKIGAKLIESGGVCVAVNGSEILGMLAGFIAVDWFGDDRTASDYLFYVRPEHRGGRAALLLLQAFEDWGEANGATAFVPGTSTLINPEATAKFFEHLGYSRSGYGFYKQVH